MAWLNKTLIRLGILDFVPSDRDPPSERRKVAMDDSCSVRMPDGSVGELIVDVMIDKVGNQNALLPLTVAIPVDVRPQPEPPLRSETARPIQ